MVLVIPDYCIESFRKNLASGYFEKKFPKRVCDERGNVSYYWQSAYIDCFEAPCVLYGYIYDALSRYINVDGTCIQKSYKSADIAMNDLWTVLAFFKEKYGES